MDVTKQARKAEAFRRLHHEPELLVLPNIWDPLGARILVQHGFPAVATASAAVAHALGYDDGQRIRFSEMLRVVRAIAAAVDVPLSADIERGYAEDLPGLATHVRQVIRDGAVGINLEDSRSEGGALRPVEEQCERIRAARRAADAEAVPLVINARIDVFLREGDVRPRPDKIAEAVVRGSAYVDAGADCLYPIGPGDLETLVAIRQGTGAPINAYAHARTAPPRALEQAEISRLSLGPNLLRAAYARIVEVAEALQAGGPYDCFTERTLSGSDMQRYLIAETMASDD